MLVNNSLDYYTGPQKKFYDLGMRHTRNTVCDIHVVIRILGC